MGVTSIQFWSLGVRNSEGIEMTKTLSDRGEYALERGADTCSADAGNPRPWCKFGVYFDRNVGISSTLIKLNGASIVNVFSTSVSFEEAVKDFVKSLEDLNRISYDNKL